MLKFQNVCGSFTDTPGNPYGVIWDRVDHLQAPAIGELRRLASRILRDLAEPGAVLPEGVTVAGVRHLARIVHQLDGSELVEVIGWVSD